MEINVKFQWCHNRPVFEVPLIETETGRGPRLPKHCGGTILYTPDLKRCAVIATKGTATYLMQRKYAHFLGVAKATPDGIGHYELSL